MITRSGLVRFWIGTVLIVVASAVTLGVARSTLGEPAPWWIGAGVGVGCLGLCVGLLARRVATEADAMRVDLPPYEPVSVLIGLGMLADVGFVGYELYALDHTGQAGTVATVTPVVVIGLGIILVHSLGDYAP